MRDIIYFSRYHISIHNKTLVELLSKILIILLNCRFAPNRILSVDRRSTLNIHRRFTIVEINVRGMHVTPYSICNSHPVYPRSSLYTEILMNT